MSYPVFYNGINNNTCLKSKGRIFMKKIYSCLALFGAAAFLGVSLISHNAIKTARAEGEVGIRMAAWQLNGGWGCDSYFVPDGIYTAVPGAGDSNVGTGNAWQYKAHFINDTPFYDALSLSANDGISFEFSIDFYDVDGNEMSKSQNGYDIDIIFAKQADLGGEIGRLRIWANSGGALNGDHSIEAYAGGAWSNLSNGSWIKGDATLKSKFTVGFDKENMITAVVANKDGLQPIYNEDGIAAAKAALGDADKVYVAIAGDNGFTANRTAIILRSFNGQSFENDLTRSVFLNDTVAPVFLDASVQASIPMNEEYEIPTLAFDILSEPTYTVKVGSAEPVEGKTFTPTEAGELTVTLAALDSVGNKVEKEYTFNVINNIEAPVITQLPTIQDQVVEPLTNVEFGMPEFTDSTGVATAELHIYKGDEEFAVLEPNSENKFVYTVKSDFEAGEYGFVYEITNAGGTTKSDKITANLSLAEVNIPNFVPFGANSIATYEEKGIRCKTIGNWVAFPFGTFDLSEGFDCKFIVDYTGMNGTGVYLHFTNADDSSYQVEYRVWPKFGAAEHDAPTNVYISYDGWVGVEDITDTGWIKRGVDDVADQYHMAFNAEDLLIGERLAGMQRVDRAYEKLQAFFEAAPSYNFEVSLGMGGWGPCPLEATLSEVNGQSLAAPITWEDAYLSVQSEVPEVIALNETLDIKAYAKDLRQACDIALEVKKPNNEVENIDFVDGLASYTFALTGNYQLNISTTGANGNKVTVTKDVVVKTSTAAITIDVEGEYQSTYATGSKITILPATFSENAVTTKIEVTAPNGQKSEVQANEEYTLAKPGLYKITYSAQDDAEPEPNKAEKVYTINVPDAEKPVITLEVNANAKVGYTVEATIAIADESDYDVNVTLVKPDNSSVKLTLNNGKVSFKAEAEGKYTIRVVVEDIYGNSETASKDIAVAAAEPTPEPEPEKKSGGCGGSIVATSSIIFVTSMLGLVALGLKKKQQ